MNYDQLCNPDSTTMSVYGVSMFLYLGSALAGFRMKNITYHTHRAYFLCSVISQVPWLLTELCLHNHLSFSHQADNLWKKKMVWAFQSTLLSKIFNSEVPPVRLWNHYYFMFDTRREKTAKDVDLLQEWCFFVPVNDRHNAGGRIPWNYCTGVHEGGADSKEPDSATPGMSQV